MVQIALEINILPLYSSSNLVKLYKNYFRKLLSTTLVPQHDTDAFTLNQFRSEIRINRTLPFPLDKL